MNASGMVAVMRPDCSFAHRTDRTNPPQATRGHRTRIRSRELYTDSRTYACRAEAGRSVTTIASQRRSPQSISWWVVVLACLTSTVLTQKVRYQRSFLLYLARTRRNQTSEGLSTIYVNTEATSRHRATARKRARFAFMPIASARFKKTSPNQ